MRGICKKLITDISRGEMLSEKLPEYTNLLAANYNLYATVKMCMNYYTMKEMLYEKEYKSAEYFSLFDTVTKLINEHIIKRNAVDAKALQEIRGVRSRIEAKMCCLTSYSDGYEIYEYILNRSEAGIFGTEEDVDIEQLSAKLYSYVFSESDTVMINSKLKLILSQLPVRMTKMKFFDILSRTLMIYTGSEKSSAREFADMVESAALISTPCGFDSEYPLFYGFYEELKNLDYKALDKDRYNDIRVKLLDNANLLTEEVSVYMLLCEIVNDVFAILLTIDATYESNQKEKGYKDALAILSACALADDVDELPSTLLAKFIDIEGVQENVYENIMILYAAYEDILSGNEALIESLLLKEDFDKLALVDKLLSTSLFINIDEARDSLNEVSDSAFIDGLKDELIEKLTALFREQSKLVTRSIMSKLLSVMPVFMNTKDEVKDYINYVLTSCKDKSELTASYRLLNEIMEEE